MEKLKSFFDDFTFYARIMPILVIFLPIIILGCIKGIITSEITETALYSVIYIVFITFISKFARNRGKQCEKNMYKELGGMPTTILMRFTDNTINKISKKKYHEILNSKLDGIELPLSLQDEVQESDQMYEAAINWLRNYANSNKKTEFMVYQELKEYNFWRNLYGIKSIALVLYLVIGVRELFLIEDFDLFSMIKCPYPKYISFWCMIISIILVIFVVNKNIVKSKAFDYAKALIEVCERL